MKPKILLVGMGRIGSIHAETINKHAILYATVSPNRSFYVENTPHYKEVNEQLIQEIDGVVLACPASWNLHYIEYFMKGGVPIFAEKPLCNTIADGRKAL